MHRFTDGGQFGLGGELAISTDKLHQRGPIGLQHLVTNKWYIYGEGLGRCTVQYFNQFKKYLLNKKTLKFQE
jgi:hypothetical protein